MELLQYIKSQLPQEPNVAIMKSLDASDELINYVKETPWNTNLNVLKNFVNAKIAGTYLDIFLLDHTNLNLNYGYDGYNTDINNVDLSYNGIKQYLQNNIKVILIDDSDINYEPSTIENDHIVFQQKNGATKIKYYSISQILKEEQK